MASLRAVALLLLLACAGSAAAAAIDPLLTWHDEIAAVSKAVTLGNQVSSRYHAGLAKATLDAIRKAKSSDSKRAIVAYTGYSYLSIIFPWRQSARLDGLIDTYLATLNLTTSVRASAKKIGATAAQKIGTHLANDGFSAFANFHFPPPQLGKYQKTEDQTFVNYPQLAKAKPFYLTSAEAEEIASSFKPHEFGSPEYNAEWDYIQAYGGQNSTVRTPYQTDTARFWIDGAGTTAITGHWLNVTRKLLPYDVPLQKGAELLAAQFGAAFDAAIVAWKIKWEKTRGGRPETVIRQGDANHAPDPTWLPLLFPTPQHPEYPSAHQTTTGSITHALVTLFPETASKPFTINTQYPGDSAVTPGQPIPDRSYANLTEAYLESRDSRVLGGTHYNKAVSDGLLIGAAVSDKVLKHLKLA